MRQKIGSFLNYTVFIIIGIFLVWQSVKSISAAQWLEFKTILKTADYWPVVPIVLIIIASHWVRALRWKMLLSPLGYNPKTANSFCAVMIGYLANLAVPRLGEILKCTALAKYEKIPSDKLVGTIVAERTLDAMSLLVLFFLSFLFQYKLLARLVANSWSKAMPMDRFHFQTKSIVWLVIVLLLSFLLLHFLIKKFRRSTLFNRVKTYIVGIWQGVVSIRHVKNPFAFFVLTVLLWGLYITATWIGFYVTLGTHGLGFSTALSVIAFGAIGMIITPGGIGSYAIIVAKVLESTDGISYIVGFANGNLQWLAQLVMVLVLGFVSLGILPFINRKSIEQKTYS